MQMAINATTASIFVFQLNIGALSIAISVDDCSSQSPKPS